jgi:hypothetical protein
MIKCPDHKIRKKMVHYFGGILEEKVMGFLVDLLHPTPGPALYPKINPGQNFDI